MVCERIRKCSFFKKALASMPSSVSRFKKLYCEGDSSMCARHYVISSVASGGRPIDHEKLSTLDEFMKNLFPNDIERAKEFVSRFGN